MATLENPTVILPRKPQGAFREWTAWPACVVSRKFVKESANAFVTGHDF